jgi:DNA-binding XRE family transcriptional regulator
VNENDLLEGDGSTAMTVSEWLGLSQAESDEIEITLALTFFLCSVRERSGLSLAQAARKLKTTPSRLAKIERGDPGASLDLLITNALKLGATFREVGEAIASWPGEPRADEKPHKAPATRPQSRRVRSAKAA